MASRFLPVNLLATEAPVGALNFLVLGDWGRMGETDQAEVAAQMGKTAQEVAAQFVISVGDNFYENGVASIHDEHWEKSFNGVYTASSLQVPWYAILGNHDYHANCEAQIQYSKISPRWHMPARYFKQTHQLGAAVTADFFFIDTTPMIKLYYDPLYEEKTRDQVITEDVPRQMAWFKKALAESKAQWKIVFGHHPIYSGGEHGDTEELIRDILPVLKENSVHAYFNGHDHDLQHLMDGDLSLFTSGGGSRVRPTKETAHTKFAETSSGFMRVSLGADQMNVAIIDNHGTSLYKTSVTRSTGALVPA